MEMLRVIFRGRYSPGLNCLENVSVGRRHFSVVAEPDFLAFFKNDQKLSKKQEFFQFKVKSNIETKTKRNYYVY
jgi:hypothetical protein